MTTIRRDDFLKRSKQFNGEVLDAVALGSPYALCRLTDPDLGESRTCWVELGEPGNDLIRGNDHEDSGERLGEWGESNPGEWAEREIVTPLSVASIVAGQKFLWTWLR